MGHLYHGYVSHNQVVDDLYRSIELPNGIVATLPCLHHAFFNSQPEEKNSAKWEDECT